MKEKFVVFTLLASIGFYNYHDLCGVKLQKLLVYLCFIVGMVLMYRNGDSISKKRYPRGWWIILLTFMLIGTLMGSVLHPQPLMQSFVAGAQLIIPLSFFFIFLSLNPDLGKLMKWLMVVTMCSIFVYIINFVTFPNNIFGEPMLGDLSRGMLRVSIPLLDILLLCYFFAINRWNDTHKLSWLFISGIGAVMLVLSLTRQAMLIGGLLGGIFLLQRYNWKQKIVVFILISVSAFTIYKTVPIFRGIDEVNEEQKDMNEENERDDIRVEAWQYYTYYGNEDNPEAAFFGNGVPSIGNSIWGKQFDAFCDETGLLIGDVSLAAFYYMFGSISTFAILVILFKAIFRRKRPEYYFLGYFILAMLLKSIASGTLFYVDSLVCIALGLALIYNLPEKATIGSILNIEDKPESKKLIAFKTK